MMKNYPTILSLALWATLRLHSLADTGLINDDTQSRLIFWKNEATMLKGNGKYDLTTTCKRSNGVLHANIEINYSDDVLLGSVKITEKSTSDYTASGATHQETSNGQYKHTYPTLSKPIVSHRDDWSEEDKYRDYFNGWNDPLHRGGGHVDYLNTGNGKCDFHDQNASIRDESQAGTISGNLESKSNFKMTTTWKAGGINTIYYDGSALLAANSNGEWASTIPASLYRSSCELGDTRNPPKCLSANESYKISAIL